MDVKHLNLTLNPKKLPEEAYKVVKHVRFDWKLDDVRFRVFTEGFTNKLIGIYHNDKPNDIVLVRVYGEATGLFIDRKDELRNFKLMHSRGYAPRLYVTFENGMAYEYLPGVVLTDDLCRNTMVYPLIAQMMAKVHKLSHDNSVPRMSRLWEKTERFIDLIPETYSNVEKQSRFQQYFRDGKSALKDELRELQRALQFVTNPIVFCHNDLLLANVIYNEDRNTVTFIDYEYAGYNYQAFDIANHFAEFAGVAVYDPSQYPSEEFQLKWIREYVKEYENCESVNEDCVRQVYKSMCMFTPVTHFFWSMWSFVQSEHSVIDFDYLAYGILRYEEYKKFLYLVHCSSSP